MRKKCKIEFPKIKLGKNNLESARKIKNKTKKKNKIEKLK